MKIEITEQDGYKVAILDGRLDTPASSAAADALEPLKTCTDKDIIFDFTELSYIASSGLRILLEMQKHARKNGHKCYIKNMNKNIREAFEFTGFIDLFDYIPSLSENNA